MKIKLCPFCGGKLSILVSDYEGNTHDEEYEKNPWSGLTYKLSHTVENNPECPIASYEGENFGTDLYDTRNEAIEAWNRRTEE